MPLTPIKITFAQIVKNPGIYVLVVVVGLLGYFAHQFVNSKAENRSDCQAQVASANKERDEAKQDAKDARQETSVAKAETLDLLKQLAENAGIIKDRQLQAMDSLDRTHKKR